LKKPGWTNWVKLWLGLALIGLWLPLPVRAQTPEPGPIYIVQPGDTLWAISQRFGVTTDMILAANGLSSSSLDVGQRLIIPGLEGVQGVLTTQKVTFGESLVSLSRQYQISQDQLARLNRLVNPDELYVGAELILPVLEGEQTPGGRAVLAAGSTLWELAALIGSNPWELASDNFFSGTWQPIPGDVLHLPAGSGDVPGGLPPQISQVQAGPLPIAQGKTVVIRASAVSGTQLGGVLVEHPLHFFEEQPGEYVALQGVHALTPPGFYPLTLEGILPDGAAFAFSQWVYVRDGDYYYDPPLTVDPDTVDPAITGPEDEIWNSLPLTPTSEKLWDGQFGNPSPYPLSVGFPSVYGSRRSYNGSPYNRFHTGLDMYGSTLTEIYAPAPGIVVYTGELIVRGNAVMIDHGWGIYTGYMHMSRIDVAAGQRVETGQLLGMVGGTGRVSGPHLHFEVWAGGVQVDPLDWLTQVYP
jgi:murein DD-endopeptidase MepM/ murein hydrolase activator NlpD